ncbi:hypothetical protein BXY66_1213 [Shimia isoporae]|uniref:Uncharacterized protein n=1 Tax=Shimia isoporae TaxID=647720 RepID=A0A4R1NV75_9RHOB|nr:hypothetical protein [Shimia isoporae]TCL09168.1 hypothetical protein BXY66_1213 [Shimia isoporae]
MATSSDATLHPMAPHFIPSWMPNADGSDPFLMAMAVLVVLLVLGAGVFYLTMHALPEQMAHGVGSTQIQIISILALLALFTHNNAFWILALLLAAINLPDFLTPLQRISNALDRATGSTEPPFEMQTNYPHHEAPEAAATQTEAAPKYAESSEAPTKEG